MNIQFCVALAAVLVVASARAEEQVIPVPGEGWRIRLNAPRLVPAASPGTGVYAGRADRLQLTVFVEPPRCPGGNGDENIYNCFAQALKKSPLVMWETERGNTTPKGVQVMYLARLDTGAAAAKSFNIHLLFSRRGKWADVHGSIAAPGKDDIAALSALMDSITIEDDAPAAGR